MLFLLSSIVVVFVLFRQFAPAMLNGKITFFIPLFTCGVVYVAVLYFTGIINVILHKEKKENEKA